MRGNELPIPLADIAPRNTDRYFLVMSTYVDEDAKLRPDAHDLVLTWDAYPQKFFWDEQWDNFVALTALPGFRIDGSGLREMTDVVVTVKNESLGSVQRMVLPRMRNTNMAVIVKEGSLRHVQHVVHHLKPDLFTGGLIYDRDRKMAVAYQDIVHFAYELYSRRVRNAPPVHYDPITFRGKVIVPDWKTLTDRAHSVYVHLRTCQNIERIVAFACADIRSRAPRPSDGDCPARKHFFGNSTLFDYRLVRLIYDFL